MKTAVFFGAGASASEGAPLQNQLLREYFSLVNGRLFPSPIEGTENRLSSFFSKMFGIDVHKGNLDQISFPTFEEALGVLDLAELKRESFNGLNYVNYPAETNNDIRLVRIGLIELMAQVIAAKLEQSKGFHDLLVKNLDKHKLLQDSIFISTNYDILVDNALVRLALNKGGSIGDVGYGLDFTNDDELNTGGVANSVGIKLFKLHGSLNWLYCATCNTLRLTPLEKSFIRYAGACTDCRSFYSPIIVPPTFFKNMSNVFISTVWNKAENSLRNVEKIIFCGYSFPDADMHIKYMLKRAEINRDTQPFSVSVINYYSGKSEESITLEEDRYRRFFKGDINYKKISFEEFAQNPQETY